MSRSTTVQKDVQDRLLNTRSSHRGPGQVVYPFHYGKDTCAFDNWNRMYMESFTHGLTMAQFETPPTTVLDLGCGGGFWVVEAAKRWTSSFIVGFDITKIQPDLTRMPPYKSIADRVQWVHGNFLDGLPFESGSFDLVRMCGLGLGIPEDEASNWQFVFEDIHRILKPNGVLECIEDDLIFPCPRPPRTRLLPIQVDFPISQSTLNSAYSSAGAAPKSDFWSSSSSFEANQYSTDSSDDQFGLYNFEPTRQSSRDSMAETEYIHTEDPQDHSRLKMCWDAMLSSRFLAPQPLSTVPFYLSSIFDETQSHPPINIPLPPSSRARNARMSCVQIHSGAPEIAADFRLKREDVNGNTARTRKSSRAESLVPPVQSSYSWSKMHLAKTVHNIQKCKEAMWVEYEQLFGNDPSVPRVTRTSRAHEVMRYAERPSARPDFERAWANWENDMMDRIGLRDITAAQCAWREPSGSAPDWRVWRNAVNKRLADSDGSNGQQKNLPELPQTCRTFRGIVCWKLVDGEAPSPIL